MEKIRVIISSDGKNEFVFFTNNLTDQADDFIRPGCQVITDQTIDWDEPSMFPLESLLHNVG